MGGIEIFMERESIKIFVLDGVFYEKGSELIESVIILTAIASDKAKGMLLNLNILS